MFAYRGHCALKGFPSGEAGSAQPRLMRGGTDRWDWKYKANSYETMEPLLGEPIYADIQNTVNNIQFQKENMYSNMQDKVVYICLIFAYTGLKCITYTTYTEQTLKNYDSFVNNINCI